MGTDELHAVAVAGIIRGEDGRLLLMRRRDHGNWEPPGGVLRVGESIHDGLSREVLEETGVEIAVDRLTGVYKNSDSGVLSLIFLCRAGARAAPATDEASDLVWAPPDEAGALLNQEYLRWVEE